MPEAVKETTSPEKIITKEVKSTEDTPSDEVKKIEGDVAPEVVREKPEEGKNTPEPPASKSEGNGTEEKSCVDSESKEDKSDTKPAGVAEVESGELETQDESKASSTTGSGKNGTIEEKPSDSDAKTSEISEINNSKKDKALSSNESEKNIGASTTEAMVEDASLTTNNDAAGSQESKIVKDSEMKENKGTDEVIEKKAGSVDSCDKDRLLDDKSSSEVVKEDNGENSTNKAQEMEVDKSEKTETPSEMKEINVKEISGGKEVDTPEGGKEREINESEVEVKQVKEKEINISEVTEKHIKEMEMDVSEVAEKQVKEKEIDVSKISEKEVTEVDVSAVSEKQVKEEKNVPEVSDGTTVDSCGIADSTTSNIPEKMDETDLSEAKKDDATEISSTDGLKDKPAAKTKSPGENEAPLKTKENNVLSTEKEQSSEMQMDSVEPNGNNEATSNSDTPLANGSSNEKEAGRSSEIDPKMVDEVNKLISDGKIQMSVSECFNAADLFGKACEIAGKLYGDLASENAELYYLYGCAMLECAKNENTVLGEAVKEKETDEEKDEDSNETEKDVTKEDKLENEEEEKETIVEKKGDEDKANGEGGEANGDEKMEVEENGEEVQEAMEDAEKEENTAEDNEETNDNGGDGEAIVGEDAKENEEDEDSSLRTAWEMFELAKVIYSKTENNLKLSETYIKLGEVGMESGHMDSIEDMKKALELRLKCAPDNDRLLAETHFNIGLAYATFQKFDEAISSFQQSKNMIAGKLSKMKDVVQTAETREEIQELSELLPDLDEKIQDMKDSKEVKLKEEQDGTNGGSASGVSEGSSSAKPASNITHLVKRKRKLEDVTSELLPNKKQPCTDEQAKPKDSDE